MPFNEKELIVREWWKLHSCPHRLSLPITPIIPVPTGEALGTLVSKDLQSLAVKHCQSLWLSDGVGLQFFVPLAQFVCKRRDRASRCLRQTFPWMEIRGVGDTELRSGPLHTSV